MIGLDTNVILRLFVDDNPAQCSAVVRLLDGRGPGSIRLDNIVIVELIWTLLRDYKRSKAEVIDIVEQLLQREELVFESRNALMTAVRLYESGRADFADYLIGISNDAAGAFPTFTFDRHAAADPTFSLVAP